MEQQDIRTKPITKSDRSIAGLYDLERSLGSGHFAVVKLANHVFTGEKVAVKVIDKTKLDDVARAHLYQEVRCMKLVQHPNVVRLYEVIDTQTKLYLILEYGDGGDMYDHIMRHEGKGISERQAKHYFKQIVSAIDYCHKLHVVHRDLKPENVIFFKSQDIAKLTDFGFSNSFLPGEKLYTSCGSLAYSAPEILLGDSYDAPAVDVWSLGVILYMMVCGKGPFSHANDSETLTMIMDCKYELPEELTEECKSLIRRMLIRLPSQRASIESIVNDKWINSGSETEKLFTQPTPLISEINIPKDIHTMVLQKMEFGKIAIKEEIQKSLDEDRYDHVTATYFLLAERILKKRFGSLALHVKLTKRHSSPYEFINRKMDDPERSMLHQSTESITPSPSDFEAIDYPDTLVNDLTHEQSHSDECLVDNKVVETKEIKQCKTLPLRSRHNYSNAIFSKQKTKSSPNLLNEITEENESELDDSPRNSPLLRRQSSQRRRKYHTCRLSPIHSRRSSCSSSDDDEGAKDRRLLTGQLIANLANQVANSNNSTSQNVLNTDVQRKDNTNEKAEDSLNEKLSSYFDYEKNSDIMNLLVPTLNLKLGGFRYFSKAYGRHLSDTNLTTYSACLMKALSKRDFKNGDDKDKEKNMNKYRQMKSSSDSNLVSVLNSLKNVPSLYDFTKTKDKFLKNPRNRNSSRNSSNLSLTSPIEEEPVIDFATKMNRDGDIPEEDKIKFSDILNNLENECLEDIDITNSLHEKLFVKDSDEVGEENVDNCNIGTGRKTGGGKDNRNNESVCCSVV